MWVFRKCIYTLLPWLLRVFSGPLRSGYYPRAWHPLHKLGKDDYSSLRSYRPISLLATMGKILELIVSMRLSHSLESKGLLAPS